MSFHCNNFRIWNTHILLSFNSLSFSATSVRKSSFKDMQSFSAEVGSRGYHVYRRNNWAKLVIHQPLQVSVETIAISRAYDSYCYKISVTRRVRIAAITFDNISGELSRFVCYFLHESSPVRYCCQYTVPSVTYTRRKIKMTFSHTFKPIVEKMQL